MKDVAVIIVSYNTRELTENCIKSVIKSMEKSPKTRVEIIIADNASTDDSITMLEKLLHRYPQTIKLIKNSQNIGFSKANNEALSMAESKYILFLNSDTELVDVNFEDMVYYMNKNENVGVFTAKVLLPSGEIDWASHRGNPTVWRSLTYFTKFEAIFARFPKLRKIFGGYHLRHLDLDTIHEIDSPSGAFYFTRAQILNKTGGFDTRFFMYGEDLDLSHRIKNMGYKIMYYPLFTVLHHKYKSGIKHTTKKTQNATRHHFFEAMRLFYEKHNAHKNNSVVNKLVYMFIDLKKKLS